MSDFKSIVVGILTEALSPSHIKKIESFGDQYSNVKRQHDEVFGKGVDRVEIPFEAPRGTNSENYNTVYPSRNTQTHHSKVFAHLHSNGYRVSDYESGYCHKTDDVEGRRKFSIGKVLAQTGGKDKPTNVYSKETHKYHLVDGTSTKVLDKKGRPVVDKPARALSVSECFENDPIRQGSKTPMKLVVSRNKLDVGGMSTGKSWTSCMNLDDGCNRHKVPADIEHGTLTGYVSR